MVLKRNFWEGGEDESEFQKREFKRRYALPSVFRDMSKTSPQKLESILEPLLRNWVKEEVDRVFNSHLRPSLNQNGSSGSRILQLHFEDKLPSTLFTGCRVESEDRKQVQIVLRDANSRKIITSGPLSSMKVNVLVLDGGFNADDSEDWTDLEFNNKTVHAREGKKPLVAGTLLISLREGVGYLEDISFTDNSRWIRSGKFRLGAKGQNSTSEVREGISNAFKVKDQRGESYKKHHPPSLADEVWRLEKIAKDGVSHKRLAKYEIFTVKDFLQMYNTRPSILRDILGGKISDKSWDTITGHATECLLDSDEHYMWKADGTTLVLNSIYKIVGTIFDGQNYQTLDVLDPFQKQLVENLKQHVYKNLNYLVPFCDQSSVACPLRFSSSQASSFYSPTLSLQNVNFPVEQDELIMQMDADEITISPMHAYGVEQRNQFQVSVGDTSRQAGDFNSILSNSFVIGDSSTGLRTCGYAWDDDVSLPLAMTDQVAVTENFQLGAPAWQGNTFIVAPGSQSLDVLPSNFGIRISSSGKPKASWCKIRALIKWQIIKSICRKNGKASKCSF